MTFLTIVEVLKANNIHRFKIHEAIAQEACFIEVYIYVPRKHLTRTKTLIDPLVQVGKRVEYATLPWWECRLVSSKVISDIYTLC